MLDSYLTAFKWLLEGGYSPMEARLKLHFLRKRVELGDEDATLIALEKKIIRDTPTQLSLFES